MTALSSVVQALLTCARAVLASVATTDGGPRQHPARTPRPAGGVAGRRRAAARRQQAAGGARLLALERGRTVTTDALIEALWPEQAPGRPQTAIQGYVSQLRKTLGPETIATEANGYRLDVAPEQLDSAEFERRLAAAPKLAPPSARQSSRRRSSSGAGRPWPTSRTRPGRSPRSRGWKSSGSPRSRRVSTPTSSAAAAPSSSASSRRSSASSLYASDCAAS